MANGDEQLYNISRYIKFTFMQYKNLYSSIG